MNIHNTIVIIQTIIVSLAESFILIIIFNGIYNLTYNENMFLFIMGVISIILTWVILIIVNINDYLKYKVKE